jgi:hypothetical protein
MSIHFYSELECVSRRTKVERGDFKNNRTLPNRGQVEDRMEAGLQSQSKQ